MIKVRYDKRGSPSRGLRLTVLETEPTEKDIALIDPKTNRGGWTHMKEDKPGTTWDTSAILVNELLQRIARTLAHHNGRKNVCQTEAESGLLY